MSTAFPITAPAAHHRDLTVALLPADRAAALVAATDLASLFAACDELVATSAPEDAWFRAAVLAFGAAHYELRTAGECPEEGEDTAEDYVATLGLGRRVPTDAELEFDARVEAIIERDWFLAQQVAA